MAETTTATVEERAPVTAGRLTLPVEGMHCASCVGRVEKAIAAVPGVTSVAVNLATERADVRFKGTAEKEPVVAAIRAAGFDVPQTELSFAIEGLHCASCVGRAEKALRAVPGVMEANVNLATERAQVRLANGAASFEDLAQAIEKAGYHAHRLDGEAAEEARHDHHADDAKALARATLIAALLTLPVFIVEMGGHLVPSFHHAVTHLFGETPLRAIEGVLTAIVLFGPGLRFFKLGFAALFRGAPEMNALVALGSGTAFLYSALVTLAPSLFPQGTAQVYYEAACVIVTLILLGRTLEARAKTKTNAAIKHLLNLAPKTARVMRDGETRDIALRDVVKGDLLLVRPGETVPVDGTIVEGSSFIDESMLTGEAEPKAKGEKAKVVGGTLNGAGSFTMKAVTLGADSVLSRIIRMVEDAQGSKLPIQALADTVAARFVPAVMALAALTFVVWLAFGPAPALPFALTAMVAVLIIACPCAMGLATPVSIMVGSGRAAELGILFRQGEALQSLRDVTAIAFDKTGTLTKGHPELTDLVVLGDVDRDTILQLAASVEAKSEHPIGKALMAAAEKAGLARKKVSDFKVETGMGVSASVEDEKLGGTKVEIGADRYMTQLGHDLSAARDKASEMGQAAKTPLYIAIDGKLAAIIAVADPLKPSAKAAVAALKAKGLEAWLITGDNEKTAYAIAAQAGIEHVIAEVLPEGKAAAIEELRKTHKSVAFAGDGINDAPALAKADVGIAVGTGTDIAIETADIVLMSEDLNSVVTAIALSHAVMTNIKQNLFWAFAYNVVLIPVAAGALYPAFGVLLSPMLGAGAMAFSSVFVLGNALRLRGFRAKIA